MAKIQIKSEKLTPFGGIFSIMEQFDALLAQTIDSTLGLRCLSIYAEVTVHIRARSTPVIPYRYFSNMIFSGRRILAEDCAPQFLTFSINIHLVPRIFPVTTQEYKID